MCWPVQAKIAFSQCRARHLSAAKLLRLRRSAALVVRVEAPSKIYTDAFGRPGCFSMAVQSSVTAGSSTPTVTPFIDENLGGDCPTILKLNRKRPRFAGFAFFKVSQYFRRPLAVLERERNSATNLSICLCEIECQSRDPRSPSISC
jgi:hypothetical protein